MSSDHRVLVPPERLDRWFTNFAHRHGRATFSVVDGQLVADAEDGEVARAELALGRVYDGPAEAATFAEAALVPVGWGLLLVRKGGFAVAAVEGNTVVSSKVGQRHVQGKTKAGGQSQQRFARRRDNQARQAYEAAAGHAHRILVEENHHLTALVCGGDRAAVDAVLASPRIAALAELRTSLWLDVPDPRRAVLDQAVRDGLSARITVGNATRG